MSLTDGHLAALADQAAASIEPDVTVQIVPDAGDDPYRWGEHSWTVRFRSDDGEEVAIGVSADEDPDSALRRLVAGLGELSRTQHRPGGASPGAAEPPT